MKILFTLESSAGMEVKMKQIKGGVTAAKGFKAASTAAGIKYKDRTDMAMIYSFFAKPDVSYYGGSEEQYMTVKRHRQSLSMQVLQMHVPEKRG